MSDTSARVPTSSAAARKNKLCRMLRNTLRSFPRARLLHGKAGFGASLDDTRLIYIRFVGPLSDQDLRDLLVLFATWLAVDPERLRSEGFGETAGVSRMDYEQSFLSNGQVG